MTVENLLHKLQMIEIIDCDLEIYIFEDEKYIKFSSYNDDEISKYDERIVRKFQLEKDALDIFLEREV